jgi:hypothetical protein
MAVTYKNQVIKMTADADAKTGKLVVMGLRATGAVAGITDTDGNPVCEFGSEDSQSFSSPLLLDGIIRGAGAGTLYVYLA